MSLTKPRRVSRERTGTDWWRCPECRSLQAQLVITKLPPYDMIMYCSQCGQAWRADTGRILLQATGFELAGAV